MKINKLVHDVFGQMIFNFSAATIANTEEEAVEYMQNKLTPDTIQDPKFTFKDEKGNVYEIDIHEILEVNWDEAMVHMPDPFEPKKVKTRVMSVPDNSDYPDDF